MGPMSLILVFQDHLHYHLKLIMFNILGEVGLKWDAGGGEEGVTTKNHLP